MPAGSKVISVKEFTTLLGLPITHKLPLRNKLIFYIKHKLTVFFKNEIFRICKLLIIFVGFRYPKENILVEDSLQSLVFTDFNVLPAISCDARRMGNGQYSDSFVEMVIASREVVRCQGAGVQG